VSNEAVRSFWMADATAWFHNVVGSFFSIHLDERTEYPLTAWLWPTTWLLAVAQAGAGIREDCRHANSRRPSQCFFDWGRRNLIL
jgi:hypothetical protein